MQDQKKQDKLIQKPQKFVPQEIKVAPLDDITAQIEALVSTSTSERMYTQMYRPVYETQPVCDIDCQCFPCRRGECGRCTGVVKRYEVSRYDPRYGGPRF
jgi:hypothetical protein